MWDDDEFVARDRRSNGRCGTAASPASRCRPSTAAGLRGAVDEVFAEETGPYRMPWSFGVNRNVIIPPMLAHGSEEVKKKFIPPMLRGDHIWCQLLSEPSGGSDLAGLLTQAARDGDVWRINGSKIWTTGGNHADYGACLARTNPDVSEARRPDDVRRRHEAAGRDRRALAPGRPQCRTSARSTSTTCSCRQTTRSVRSTTVGASPPRC